MIRRWRRHEGGCEMPGCDHAHHAQGLCAMHYRRLRRHGDPLGGGTPDGEPMAYLLAVLTTMPECTAGRWPYNAKGGYGRIGNDYVHILVCTWYHDERPEGMLACHRCGKGHLGCFSPSCLYWGTVDDDAADRRRHGRVAASRRAASPLTPEQVDEIRAAIGTPLGELAARYGVAKSTISRIQTGKRWT